MADLYEVGDIFWLEVRATKERLVVLQAQIRKEGHPAGEEQAAGS